MNEQKTKTKNVKRKIRPPNVKYQYKGTCMTCRKYGLKSKDFWHRKGENIPKGHYCDKSEHVKQDSCKKTREDKPRNYNSKDNKKKCNYCKINNKKEKD